jgi:WS/DGAT/MGAT family acyltransferase
MSIERASTERATIEPHVSDADAFTFRMERDPLLRSTIVAVVGLDRSPDWDHFRRRVDRATRLAPSFRAKLVESPLRLAPPRWVLDPDFDLSWHLRRLRVPEGGGMAAVLELARTTGMTAFDHERPMWEVTLVDGLPDGRAALVLKVHHALTDGIGGIQIAAHAVDATREPVELDLPPLPRPGRHGLVPDLLEALGHDVRVVGSAGRALLEAAPRVVTHAVTQPAHAAAEIAATGASLARFVRPVLSTRSPIMRDRRLHWHYDLLDVPLAPLKAAAARVDGSLNDAFVAGVAGGVRLYHDHHGTMLNQLRMSMPISLRTDDDPEGGNHITLARFDVPVGRHDPLERMREIGQACRAERDEPSLAYSNQVAAVLNLLPPATVGGMLKHVDVVASNVPGFPVEVYVSGAMVESFHAFGPTSGTAANVTLMSYRDTCHIGVNTDGGAIPDPDLFLASLREAFAEITALATKTPPKRPRRSSTRTS